MRNNTEINFELSDKVTKEQRELIFSISDTVEGFYKKCHESEKFSPSTEELVDIIKTLYINIPENRIKAEIKEMTSPLWSFKKINDKQFVVTNDTPMAGRSWFIDTERNITFLLWLS